MSVPRTSAMMARPPTTTRVLFSSPINGSLLGGWDVSPREVAERPPRRGAEARDHRQTEACDRHRGQGEDTGVRDHGKVEDHQRTRECRDERMDAGEAQATAEHASDRERDARNPEERGHE